jgi:hypothetical protein
VLLTLSPSLLRYLSLASTLCIGIYPSKIEDPAAANVNFFRLFELSFFLELSFSFYFYHEHNKSAQIGGRQRLSSLPTVDNCHLDSTFEIHLRICQSDFDGQR